MKKKYTLLSLLLALVLMLLTGCKSSSSTGEADTTAVGAMVSSTEAPTTVPETTAEEIKPVSINIVAVGDMLMHSGVSKPAVQDDGSYVYDYLFEHVTDKVKTADLAVVNNEVVMAGNQYGNIGYPCFNVRTELADAEVKAGFDVALLATNHSMDQDTNGMIHTLNYWKEHFPDIITLGANLDADAQKKICIKNINGIDVALLNYTYGTNGINVPEERNYLINYMREEDKPRITKEIQRAKSLADFVIVFPHWGTEYVMTSDDMQKEWAKFFAEQGVDLIIGTHPHVVEPVEWVEGKDGHKMLVYYSLGNFTSLQYYNFSMLGGMADVKITKDANGTHIDSYDMHFLVTHFTRSRSAMTTYFLDDYTEDLAAEHSIHTEPGEEYMSVNRDYPFTAKDLKKLAKSICPDLPSTSKY